MTEHEYRLNRNEWLYKEIKDLSNEHDIVDSFILALENAAAKEPECKRIKQYIKYWNDTPAVILYKMADMWELEGKGIEDCMEWLEEGLNI